MGKNDLSYFGVTLDRETAGNLYEAGSSLTGIVYFQATKQVRCKAITVTIYGESEYTVFDSQSARRYKERKIHLSWTQTIFTPADLPAIHEGEKAAANEKANSNDSKGILLANRNYAFQFSFKIPAKDSSVLPVSYESPLGHTRYHLKCEVVRPGRKKNYTVVKPFIIEKLCMPFAGRTVGKAQKDRVSAKLGNMMAKGIAEMSVYIESDTHAAGDRVPVRISITNRSPVDLKGIFVGIMNHVTLTANNSVERTAGERFRASQDPEDGENAPSSQQKGAALDVVRLKRMISDFDVRKGTVSAKTVFAIDLPIELPSTFFGPYFNNEYSIIVFSATAKDKLRMAVLPIRVKVPRLEKHKLTPATLPFEIKAEEPQRTNSRRGAKGHRGTVMSKSGDWAFLSKDQQEASQELGSLHRKGPRGTISSQQLPPSEIDPQFATNAALFNIASAGGVSTRMSGDSRISADSSPNLTTTSSRTSLPQRNAPPPPPRASLTRGRADTAPQPYRAASEMDEGYVNPLKPPASNRSTLENRPLPTVPYVLPGLRDDITEWNEFAEYAPVVKGKRGSHERHKSSVAEMQPRPVHHEDLGYMPARPVMGKDSGSSQPPTLPPKTRVSGDETRKHKAVNKSADGLSNLLATPPQPLPRSAHSNEELRTAQAKPSLPPKTTGFRPTTVDDVRDRRMQLANDSNQNRNSIPLSTEAAVAVGSNSSSRTNSPRMNSPRTNSPRGKEPPPRPTAPIPKPPMRTGSIGSKLASAPVQPPPRSHPSNESSSDDDVSDWGTSDLVSQTRQKSVEEMASLFTKFSVRDMSDSFRPQNHNLLQFVENEHDARSMYTDPSYSRRWIAS
eukprot:Clim_evm27s167 gene=Clim_evmTU27s167